MEEFRIYTDWKFDLRNAEYEPTIKDVEKGIIVEPMKCAKVCVPKGTTIVRARRLERKVKLFRDKDETNSIHLAGLEITWLTAVIRSTISGLCVKICLKKSIGIPVSRKSKKCDL